MLRPMPAEIVLEFRNSARAARTKAPALSGWVLSLALLPDYALGMTGLGFNEWRSVLDQAALGHCSVSVTKAFPIDRLGRRLS